MAKMAMSSKEALEKLGELFNMDFSKNEDTFVELSIQVNHDGVNIQLDHVPLSGDTEVSGVV